MSVEETIKNEKIPEEEMVKINGGQGEPTNKKCEYPNPQR